MTEPVAIDRWLWVRDAELPLNASVVAAAVDPPRPATLQQRERTEPPDSPEPPDVVHYSIPSAADRRDHDQPSQHAEELLKARRQSQAALEALMLAAMVRSDYTTAAQHGAQLVEYGPLSYQAWFNLGLCFQKLNRIDDAVQAYMEAIHSHEEEIPAHVNLAVILLQQGDIEGARREFDHFLKEQPDHAMALWNLAILQEKDGQPEKAEALYLRLIAGGHNVAQAWFRLGYIRLREGNFREAVQSFERCLIEQPAWRAALFNLSLAQWRSGERHSAATTLERTLLLDAHAIEALRLRAALAIESGDCSTAAGMEARLSKLGENTSELAFNIGVLQQKANLFPEAVLSYRSALNQDPGFAPARLNLGHALNAIGQNEDAQSEWQAALEAKPELAGSYFKALLAKSAA